MKGCQAPSCRGGNLEVALSRPATSLGKYLPSVSVSKASQLCETLVSGQARSGSVFEALNSSVPGSGLKSRVGVSHYTQYINVHTKVAQEKLSSAVCFTGERIHLGFAGPDFSLNWEKAVQHLPITSPGTRTASRSRNWMRAPVPSAYHAPLQLLWKSTQIWIPVFTMPC